MLEFLYNLRLNINFFFFYFLCEMFWFLFLSPYRLCVKSNFHQNQYIGSWSQVYAVLLCIEVHNNIFKICVCVCGANRKFMPKDTINKLRENSGNQNLKTFHFDRDSQTDVCTPYQCSCSLATSEPKHLQGVVKHVNYCLLTLWFHVHDK